MANVRLFRGRSEAPVEIRVDALEESRVALRGGHRQRGEKREPLEGGDPHLAGGHTGIRESERE